MTMEPWKFNPHHLGQSAYKKYALWAAAVLAVAGLVLLVIFARPRERELTDEERTAILNQLAEAAAKNNPNPLTDEQRAKILNQLSESAKNNPAP